MQNNYYIRKRRRDTLAGYAFSAPAIILFLAIGLYTVFMSITMSFYNWHIDISQSAFVGLKYYSNILLSNGIISERFFTALINNIKFAVYTMLLVIPSALILALIINGRTYFKKGLRSIYMIPMAVNGTAIAFMWKGIFQPEGLLNYLFTYLKLDFLVVPSGWLGSMDHAFYGIIITVLWSTIPLALIFYNAALSIIDVSLYEVADIEGAKAHQKFIHVTWPQVLPITMVIAVMLINNAFKMFPQIYVLTHGGPADSTQVLGTLIYDYAFEQAYNGYGIASAIGWLGFIVTIFFSAAAAKILMRKD